MKRNKITGTQDDSLATRSSLLGRLKDWEDDESWREFFRMYWKLIYHFVLGRGLTHEEAEEVVQETVLAVARSIENFEYRPDQCAFKSWLLTVTRSKISKQLNRRCRLPIASNDDSTGVLAEVPDTQGQEDWESAWEDEWRRNLMDGAVQRVKERIPIEHYQMFDLFVLKGWPARDVARTLGVTVAHVYVVKHRVGKMVQKQFILLEKNSLAEASQATMKL